MEVREGTEGWAKEISRIITVQMNILRGLLGMRRMDRIHKPRVSVAWSEERGLCVGYIF